MSRNEVDPFGRTIVDGVLQGFVTVHFKDGVPQTHPRINVTFVDGGIKIRYDNGSWVWIPHHQINAVKSGRDDYEEMTATDAG